MLDGMRQLLNVVQRQQKFPEMLKVTRVLAGGNRPEVDMADVFGQAWGWFPRGTPYVVYLALNDAHNVYWQITGNDPRTGPVGTKDVVPLTQAVTRAVSFAKKVENAYLDATRTQQEQFFNARAQEDLYTSIERDIRGVQDERWGV